MIPLFTWNAVHGYLRNTIEEWFVMFDRSETKVSAIFDDKLADDVDAVSQT